MKKKLLKFLQTVFPNYIYQMIMTRYLQFTNRNSEYKYELPYFHSCKKGASQKFCVFRFHRPGSGLFAVATSYVFAYEWAISKGYIPILDWEMDYSFMNYRIGEENIWESIFKQKYTVKEVLDKEWVWIAPIGMHESMNEKTCLEINNKGDDCKLHIITSNWKEYYKKAYNLAKECWKFCPSLENAIDNFFQENMQGNIFLGVALQEDFSKDAEKLRTDEYAKEVYSQHPKTMGLEETIGLVQESLKKWKCEKIFVASIYQESVDLFKEVFGDIVVCIDRKRRDLSESTHNIEKLFNMNYEEMYYHYKNSEVKYEEECIPYAKEVALLSKCQYLIAAPSSGTIAALTLNAGEYKDICILQDYNQVSRY